MKTVFGITLVLAVFCFFGCESAPNNTQYRNMAEEHDFYYFFPADTFNKSFDSVEEAYDYVKAAQIKFSSSSGKIKAKGNVAKLFGTPAAPGLRPVTVLCIIWVQGDDNRMHSWNGFEPLEKVINSCISAIMTFLVFYEDRGIAIPAYYIRSGWRYNNNQSQKSYEYGDRKYSAEYPPGWSVEKAFRYLKKEIN